MTFLLIGNSGFIICNGIQCAHDCARLNESIGSLGIGTYLDSYIPPSGIRPVNPTTRARARSRSNAAPRPASNYDTPNSNSTSEPPSMPSSRPVTPVPANNSQLPHDWAHPLFTASLDTPVFDIVHWFSELGFSAVPIVDNQGRVINLYETIDIVDLIKSSTYNQLDLTIEDALRRRARDFPGVVTCSPEDTLSNIMDYIKENRVHRMVIVESDDTPSVLGKTKLKGRLVGLLCLSDILTHLVGQSADVLRGVDLEEDWTAMDSKFNTVTNGVEGLGITEHLT